MARATGQEPYEEELNEAVTPSPGFHIARYPVTVAQFRAFVDATGFALGDTDAVREIDSRPVRWVSWNGAQAYCAWLQRMCCESPALADCAAARRVRDQGWQVALPSELEWEKAARGGHAGLVFPWGDEPEPQRANYADSGIGDSSVVGCFAPNDHGLFDMVGNLWEWTRSPWQKAYGEAMLAVEAVAPDGERNKLVVRGGSWLFHCGSARCAIRSWLPSDSRNDYLGFRVVLRSSHVLPPLLLVAPAGAAARQRQPRAPCSGNAGRPAQAGRPAEAKEEEQRQMGLVRARVARNAGARLTAGHSLRRAHSKSGARPGPTGPAAPRPAPELTSPGRRSGPAGHVASAAASRPTACPRRPPSG